MGTHFPACGSILDTAERTRVHSQARSLNAIGSDQFVPIPKWARWKRGYRLSPYHRGGGPPWPPHLEMSFFIGSRDRGTRSDRTGRPQ